MYTRRFFLASLVTVLAFGAGGCGSSTSPSAVVLTVSGSWDVTITAPVGNVPALMTLTETSGTVTGRMQIGNDSEALSGTVTLAGEMLLAYRDPVDGEQGRILVTVDAARLSFSGTLTITPAQGQEGTVGIKGAKRP